MRKTKYVLTIVILVCTLKGFAQDYQKQRNEIFISNIISNGLISGVASSFNKKPNEKLWHVFAKNFGKGCLGGLIKYTAKYQTYYFRYLSNAYFGNINRAFFFLGHSMVVNASMNERLLQNYYCHFYGFNFRYQSNEKKGNKLQARLSATTLGSLFYLYALGDRIDIYKTLEYGQFYLNLRDNATLYGNSIGGMAMFNTISIKNAANGSPFQGVVPHEISHTFQVYDLFGLSSIYKKKLDKVLTKSKAYNTISRFVDLDYEPIFYSIMYQLQPKPRYYKNYFEFEAEHFSSRLFIER